MTPRIFTWIRKGELAISGRPLGVADLMEMREEGIGAVVSLTESPLRTSELDECGLERLHLPVPDFSPPTLRQIEDFAAFAADQRARANAVLIHCGSGRGRSGTMAACHLVSRGLDPEKALAEVRRLQPGAVETDEQEEIVRAWAEHLRTRSSDAE